MPNSAQPNVSAGGERFTFGRNWAEYVEKYYSDERVRVAQGHLLEFLKLDDLRGRSFLDIGCGSGVHSLAAWRSGASSIVSFDYDPESVATTTRLWEAMGKPTNWNVQHGSVLDEAYVRTLEPADIVYSWGVLHHTGDMWKAVRIASIPVKNDGLFYIALYSKEIYVKPPWQHWLKVKRAYNRAGTLRKRLMEWHHAWRATMLHDLKALRMPWRSILDYQRERGMSYWTDVRDWLGGWPMEFAGNMETVRFCAGELGLEVLNTRAGEGNTEFLFRRAGARTYWDSFIADKELVDLPRPFEWLGGHAWRASLGLPSELGDSRERPLRSLLMLYEDEVPLGFAHQTVAAVKAHGSGRYLHSGSDLMFSASDCTDPNTNGKRYRFRLSTLYSQDRVDRFGR